MHLSHNCSHAQTVSSSPLMLCMSRRERAAGASTSYEPLPRHNSPSSPPKSRKQASGAKSSKSTTGVKRKLANALGSPAAVQGGTPTAPLPLQSVFNGQLSNREGQAGPTPPTCQSGGMCVMQLHVRAVSLQTARSLGCAKKLCSHYQLHS